MELVVGASEATMKCLLVKLGNLLAQEYALIRGVRGDIQYINDELASMQAFLRDLSTAPEGHDNRMRDWMKQIRDISYDTEDFIDNFADRLPRHLYKVSGLWSRREIASNIAELKARAQQIAERRSRYGVNNPDSSIRSSTGVRTGAAAYYVAEHQVSSRQLIGIKEPVCVGKMDVEMKKLEDWLTKHDETTSELAVLSIVGFGGVGKTTMATALYRKVRNVFDCQASVTVSQNYDEDTEVRSQQTKFEVRSSNGTNPRSRAGKQ